MNRGQFIANVSKNLLSSQVVRTFMTGYFCAFLLGWILLELPVSQKQELSRFDLLFTAASALSTTGLVLKDVGSSFSFFGQNVIMLLIEIGGISYMALSSYIILYFGSRTPSKILLRSILIYTGICEAAGAAALFYFFQERGMDNAFFQALFHSISAFCTAGFALVPLNIDHSGINITLSVLSLLGAFGFFLGVSLCRKNPLQARPFSRLLFSFTTAVIALSLLLLLALSQSQNVAICFFQTVSAVTTTGFMSADMGRFTPLLQMLFILFMLTGASLVGSGTNMKGTSFVSCLRLSCSFKTHRLLLKRLQIVLTTFWFYLVLLLVSGAVLSLVESQNTLSLFFEAASALCTVGLSVGVTAKMSFFGKTLILLLMLLGKKSILLLGYALSRQQEAERAPSYETIS